MNVEAQFVADLAAVSLVVVLALVHPYLALGLACCGFMWRGTR